MYDDETILIMLDPLSGFAGVNDALGGERVTVGGTRGFNPLDIQPTPVDLIHQVPDCLGAHVLRDVLYPCRDESAC
jgi:hypothetical protein